MRTPDQVSTFNSQKPQLKISNSILMMAKTPNQLNIQSQRSKTTLEQHSTIDEVELMNRPIQNFSKLKNNI